MALDMDITKVFMVRSAKGCDMLCVDNYLYHYEDRGTNSYRWVCNKRKDKLLPCRSRLITTLVDGDETKHSIQKVVGDHTHNKCGQSEISKALERKRLADLAGEACTLEHKAEKRKAQRLQKLEQSVRRSIKKKHRGAPDNDNSYDDSSDSDVVVAKDNAAAEDNNDDDDDDVEWADWLKVDDDMIEKPKPKVNTIKQMPKPLVIAANREGNRKRIQFKADQLYIFKSAQGRHFVCLNGFLYSLEGKSPTSGIYCWRCVRQRSACKTRLYTVRLPNGTHKLRQLRGSANVQKHTHSHYTSQQLMRLMVDNKLTLMSGQAKSKVSMQTRETTSSINCFEQVIYCSDNTKTFNVNDIIEECAESETDALNTSTMVLKTREKKRSYTVANSDSESDALNTSVSDRSRRLKKRSCTVRESDDEVSRIARVKKVAGDNITYVLETEPLKLLDAETDKSTSATIKKFAFLPSAKGNQVLCLDNSVYHYDSRSATNGRTYWTCIMRRDKKYKCNARITTEMRKNVPTIVKVSGYHEHANNMEDIKRRLSKSAVAKNASDTDMRSDEMLESSVNELGDDFKRIVAKSEQNIKRRISRLRMNLKREKVKSNTVSTFDDQNDSSSSFSSALESGDDHFEFVKLPTKLEQMREKVCEQAETTFEIKVLPKSGSTNEMEEFETEVLEECLKDIDDSEEEETYMDTTYFGYEDIVENNLEKVPRRSSRKEPLLADLDSISHIKPIFKRGRKHYPDTGISEPDMDATKISKLRSAKGGELLCVDGYIYHLKRTQNLRTYWTCIKSKDRIIKCKSRVATVNTADGIKVFSVTNHHSHPVNEQDIKRRLYNELARGIPNVTISPKDVLKRSLHELSEEYADMLANSKGSQKHHAQNRSKVGATTDDEIGNQLENEDGSLSTVQSISKNVVEIGSIMKLHAVSDGPPSLAVRMTLKALKISFELVNVDYVAAEHLSDEYAKMNPQKEIPVLEDNGFYLSESIAIMQYLCDKYAPDSSLYPKNAKERAVVNHRLCFNMGFYYSSISAYAMAPIFFDYPRTDMGLKKVNNSLLVFETYLQKAGTKYAAADHVTIADFALVSATMCLEAIAFDLTPYPLIRKWYMTFKQEQPELWKIADGGMQEIAEFEKNPPDLSHMNHPFHPTRKSMS